MEVRGYLRVIGRWKWLILLVTLTCAVTAGVASLQLPKLYASNTTAVASPKQVIPSAGVNNPNQLPNLDQVVDTYAGLINSEPVRQRLIQSGVPRSSEQLSGEILVARKANTTLIQIRISDNDPGVAFLIARNIIPAFNDALDELQSSVRGGTAPTARLDSLIPWELPSAAPRAPYSPDIPRNVIIALAAGLVLATALAFLIERIDDTVKTEGDVQLRLGLPLLGTVVRRVQTADEEVDDPVEVVAASHMGDTLAEQYRAIRTNVMFSRVDRPVQTIVVTSTLPGEGKTTTATNLAMVMAQAGFSTILVDADFRRPSLHRLFDRRPNLGLGNLILDDRPSEQLIQATTIPMLRLVCSGPTPPNPSELLGSVSMQRVLARLSSMADIVILDTPPVSAVTDATVLATLCGGVIMVVEQRRTGVPAVAKSIETLHSLGANILGVVLNKCRAKDIWSYYYDYGEPGGETADEAAVQRPAVRAVSAGDDS